MVLDYYNLKEQPFGVTPDPRYLFMSASHREALASLSCGITNGRGFMSLIAKPGMGKTTTLFELLNELKDSARTVFLFQTFRTQEDLLRAVLRDLGVMRVGTSMVRMQEQLNRLLVEENRRGRKVVVVIDEAQNLEEPALELLRMLSNFETASDKMMQIVLAGQPQLRERLASPQLLQLRQRMSIFARLDPFDAGETRCYIEHRLRVAGYRSETPVFKPRAEAMIARYSEGIPRNINNICFNALSLGRVLKQKTITEESVVEVLRDLEFMPSRVPQKSSQRSFSGWSSIRPSAVFQQAFAWRKRLAVSFGLLLTLLWLSGPSQGAKANTPVPAPVVAAASQPQPVPVVSTPPQEAPGHPLSHSRRAQARTRAEVVQSDVAQSDDVAKLWRQVRTHHSEAEVKLASIYLEGTVVSRNCTQAQILLQDASRKGNTRAKDLLNDPAAQCHKSQ